MNSVEINLRNWRDVKRAKRTKKYFDFNVLLILSFLCLAFFMNMYRSSFIGSQENVNNYLKTELSVLDSNLTTIDNLKGTIDQITERMEIINSLQSNRSELVIIFDEMALITPKEIRLVTLKRENGDIEIEGVSISQLNISSFLKNLDNSDNFKNPRLVQVIADKKVEGFERSRFFIKAEERVKSSIVSGVNKDE